MLKPRLITSFLVDSSQHLVKTINFSERNYLGDPLNAAYIFSGFEVDELLVLDIDASLEGRTISYDFVKALASFTKVPLSVGGGISELSHIQDLLSFGVEKIVISSEIENDFSFLEKAVNKFGSSSISVIINVKHDLEKNTQVAYLGRSRKNSSYCLESLSMSIQNSGAGELIINNIDLEGTRKGFDIALMKKLNEKLSIPLVALGGAGNIKHIEDLLMATPINGIACGTFFVYANESKDVLMNYEPTAEWLKNNFESLIKKFIK